MATDSRHTVLHAKGGDQKWQRSSGIPRQLRVQTSHHSFVLSFPAEKLPKSMATCAVMIVVCSLGGPGEQKHNARNQNGLVLTPEVSWWLDRRVRWASEAPRRPPSLGSQKVADAGRGRKPTGSSKPFRKRPFIQPWPFRPLQRRCSGGTWWRREFFPFINVVGLLIILAQRTLCIPRIDSIYLEGRRLGFQFFLFPCKKWPQHPRPLCKFLFP